MRREEALRKYERYLARLQKWFPILERWLPWLAHRFAYYLFFKPFLFPTPVKEQEAAKQASQEIIQVGAHRVQLYDWGTGAQIVVFVHGWSGRGLQVFKFLPTLLNNGFRVIAFDAPGHGNSTGSHSDVSLFRDTINKINIRYGPIYGIMGHSLGGAAALLAINEGLSIAKAIVISTPSNGPEVLQDFLTRIGASRKTGEYLDRIVKKRYGRTLDEFSAHNSAQQMPDVDTLLVYDEDDEDVPLHNGETLHAILRNAELLITQRFGHTRILRSDEVINAVALFLKAP